MPTHQRPASRRHGEGRTATFVAAAAVAALTALAALCTADPLPGWGGSAGAAGTGGADSTWLGYFFPLKVGWTCHESLTGSGATGSETLTIAAVGRVRQGRSVTVDEGSSSTLGATSVPTNGALHYILTNEGQLISVPSDLQISGQPYGITGDTTYPSIKTLLSGGSAVSHLHIELPLNATDRAELQAVLPAKATSLDMAVDVAQHGNPVATLQTSSGTFHHVVVVHSTAKSLAFTNIGKVASQELAGAILPTISKEVSSTTWYAPGVGPIKDSAGGFTSTVTSCGFAAG